MWQEIAIGIIGIGVVAYLGWKVYNSFTRKKNPDNPCGGCSGCALKKEINKHVSPPATGCVR